MWLEVRVMLSDWTEQKTYVNRLLGSWVRYSDVSHCRVEVMGSRCWPQSEDGNWDSIKDHWSGTGSHRAWCVEVEVRGHGVWSQTN